MIPFNEDMPVYLPVNVVGGRIMIGPNENLTTDEPVVAFEAIIVVPPMDEESAESLALLPILMDVATWDALLIHMTDNTEEPNTPSEEDTE